MGRNWPRGKMVSEHLERHQRYSFLHSPIASISLQARLSEFVEEMEEQPVVRLLVQVVKCKQCNWATTSKEELQKHIARHHTDNMRWW